MDDTQAVAVIGSGLVGCLVAKGLAERGFRVNLYDGRMDPADHDYEASYRSINLALSARGIKALRSIDPVMAETLLAKSVPVKARMIHLADGREDSQAYGLHGEVLNSADRAVLNHGLVEEVRAMPNVRLFFSHKLLRADFDKLELTFDVKDGKREVHRAAFVIGADGAYSKVREQMMRVVRMDFEQSYIQDAYLELSMPATADGDWAISPDHLHIWPRHDFMLIALPNPERTFTCTLFAPYHTFDALKTDQHILRFFRTHFGDALPHIGEAALLRCFAENPRSALISLRCTPYHHADRALILGDAAHAMLPFYGQGLNCGFEDVGHLLRLFDAHQVEPGRGVRVNLRAAFAEYTATRKASLDAIADLAAANFVEMRSKVASPLHVVRRRVDRTLARVLGPRRWLPLYTMVTFKADMSYAEAKRRGELQERIVEGAMYACAVGVAAGIAWFRFGRNSATT